MANDTAPATTNDQVPAASRKPDAIAREIELTRAELADTIDAIADRISPKRAVSRGRQAVRAQMSSVSGRGQEQSNQVIALDEPAGEPDAEAADSGTPSGAVSPSRLGGVDPRLLVAGAVVGATVGLLVLRRKRS